MSKTVFFSVGEPSGDEHAARLIRRLTPQRQPVNFGLDEDPIQFRGFGGPAMRAAGCRLDLELTQHAIVGLVEVLPKLREFFRFTDQAGEIFARNEIDAVMLVDFPGFNWHIARRAKEQGIPVYYYCPPQLWAWGGWRVRKMKRLIDHVLTVLPMEQEYFSSRGIETTFVGHPFFDAVAETKLDQRVLNQLAQSHTNDETQLVAVLPGSRGHEVRGNWPIMLESIRRLVRRYPNARFAIACYRDSQCLWCRDQMKPSDQSLPIDFFIGCTSEIIEAAHCAMMVSGSVSLELMARGTPAAVIYRVGRVLYRFAKTVLNVDSMTLPNLMKTDSRESQSSIHEKVFPEMVSVSKTDDAVEFLEASIGSLLGDSFYYQRKLAQLEQLKSQYAVPGATENSASWLCEKLGVSIPNQNARLPIRAAA